MPSVVNIAAYKFAALDDLQGRKQFFLDLSAAHELRGTIMLSGEGINLVVAGQRAGIDALMDAVRMIPGLGEIEVKESFSDSQPFDRMLVKIKPEIIAFGVDGIDPLEHTSPRITARELKAWLDEGRTFTLLDTRNNFEVEAGTFEGAVPIGVDNFRDLPRAVAELPEEVRQRMQGQPVVTFCTGGIRCEKAAPFLEQADFGEVYQLDGGILKYFEEVGGAHYHGDCFVFDQRVALDPSLEPSLDPSLGAVHKETPSDGES